MLYSSNPDHIYNSKNHRIRIGNDLLDQFLNDWNLTRVPKLVDVVDWIVPEYDSIAFMRDVECIEKAYLWSSKIYERKWFAIHLKIADENFNKLAMDEWITQKSICEEFVDTEMRAKCGIVLGRKKTEISIIIKGMPHSPEDFVCMLRGFESSLGLPFKPDRKYFGAKISFEAYYDGRFSEAMKGTRVSFLPLLDDYSTVDDIKNYYRNCMSQAFMKMAHVQYISDVKESIQKKIIADEESFLEKTCPCNHFLCHGSRQFTLTPMCFLPLLSL